MEKVSNSSKEPRFAATSSYLRCKRRMQSQKPLSSLCNVYTRVMVVWDGVGVGFYVMGGCGNGGIVYLFLGVKALRK